MRGLLLFAVGVLAGGLSQTTFPDGHRIVGLNHVAISVADYEAALMFYTKILGFRQAFTIRDTDGTLALTYLQINRDTFLELQPATPTRPPGFLHIGLDTQSLPSTVAHLRNAGLQVGDPRLGRTKAPLTLTTTPDGTRLELFQLGPESLQRQAMKEWR